MNIGKSRTASVLFSLPITITVVVYRCFHSSIPLAYIVSRHLLFPPKWRDENQCDKCNRNTVTLGRNRALEIFSRSWKYHSSPLYLFFSTKISLYLTSFIRFPTNSLLFCLYFYGAFAPTPFLCALYTPFSHTVSPIRCLSGTGLYDLPWWLG